MNQTLAITGRYRLEVIDHNGAVIASRPWRKNLLLDQGLNKLATVSFAELFNYAAKGDGTTATKETVTGTYTLAGSTLTRITGARDFTIADEGRLIRNQDGIEVIVDNYTDATHVDVRAVGSGSLTNYTTKTIVIYYVEQIGLGNEIGDRTGLYSSVTGENSTTDGTGSNKNKRTLKRTFVFDAEPDNIESLSGSYTYAGTTVTRTVGVRDFVAGDVGKYLRINSTVYGKIASITSVSVVEMDRTGSFVGSITTLLYGFNEYSEIGFSDLEAAGDNINIRVRLEDGGGSVEPIALLGENPETPGQQLKVTYEMTVSLTPVTVTTATPAPITDPGNIMSSNKNFTSVIESLAISRVDPDGSTSLEYAGLEPSVLPFLGISPSTTALASFGNTDRTSGEAVVEMAADDYVEDSFQIIQRGTFGINDAIGTTWRTVGLVDSDNNNFLFTMLFAGNQRKDGTHTLSLAFVKSWNRDLS